jgi:hypothetical protein
MEEGKLASEPTVCISCTAQIVAAAAAAIAVAAAAGGVS